MSAAGLSATQQLAEFSSSLGCDDLPAPVRERAKDILLDSLASAFAGHDAAETASVLEFSSRLAGGGDNCTIIGAGRSGPARAVLCNGYLITGVTVCDIHRPTQCHVTPEVVPPALAVAEMSKASGADLLAACAGGLEVAIRVGLGFDPASYKGRGWHSPGVIGPFGGAAAAGRILGLKADRQVSAFGLAGSQAAGTYAQLGTPGIKFQQSRGALSGLLAAMAASSGLGSCDDMVGTGNGRLYAAYANGDPARAVDGLGQRWEFLNLSLRAWPVAAHLQSVVTGLLELSPAVGDPRRVAHLRVVLSPKAYEMHGALDWDNRFRARLSARFVSGVTLLDGRCWLEQFTADRVGDPELAAFIGERVLVEASDDIADGTTRITCVLGSGETLSRHVTQAKGEPGNPLERDEIVTKFHRAATGRLTTPVAERVIGTVLELDQVADISSLVADLSGGAPPAGA